MLGMTLKTHQTGPEGRVVRRLLIEQGMDLAGSKEMYLAILVDRASGRPVFMASTQGGMDIEEVAAKNPEAILKEDDRPGGRLPALPGAQARLRPRACRPSVVAKAVPFITALYKAFEGTDASLVEINPFLITKAGDVLALDAKIGFDDNALFRHPELEELRDFDEEEPLEVEASKYSLNYIKLEGGNVGCMVNGAGLAMATMDIIKLAGGAPANFLDVGGGANAEQIKNAFRILLADTDVQAVLINIFGGILRCDVLAEGVIAAVRDLSVKVPVVVRMKGNNEEKGQKMLQESGLNFDTADDMTDGGREGRGRGGRCAVSVLALTRHAAARPGHGQARHLPRQGLPRLRHAGGGRRHAGQGRHHGRGLPALRHGAEAVDKTGANASVVFVPPAGAADAILEAGDAGIALVVASPRASPPSTWCGCGSASRGSKTRLIGPNCPGIISPGEKCKIGIMPGHIHMAGPGRRREPQRHAHLRGGRAAHGARHRADHLHRHRRRPDHRHQLHGRAAALQRGPGHRGDRDDRRDRRQRRGRGGRLRQGAREEAGGGLHRRADGAAGAAHGPRRRDHLRRQGHRRREDEGDGRPPGSTWSSRPRTSARPSRTCSRRSRRRRIVAERTFSIIKPDAVKAGNAGAILARLEKAGFRIVGLRLRT